MQTGNSKLLRFLILLLAFSFNIIIVSFFQERGEMRERMNYRRGQEAFLEKMYASFKFEKVFNSRFNQLFADVGGKTASEAVHVGEFWLRKHGLASDSCEIVYYNNRHPLNVASASVDDWRFMLEQFDVGLIRPRLEGETKNRLLKLLNGGVGFPRLEGKPGVLQKVTIAGERTYGIWFSAPERYATGVNAMIALVHEKKITDRLLAGNLFASFAVSSAEYGYVNLFNPEDSIVPEGLNPYVIAPRVSGMDIKSGFEYLVFGTREVLVSFKPDGHIFLAGMSYRKIPVPLWTLALFFLWVPLWFRFFYAEDSFRLSLTTMITFVFVISMALPVVAVGFYWNLFLDSRRESARIETAARLEKLLIQLDTCYAEEFRILRKKYRDLVKILDGKPDRLQEFIDQSVRLELEFLFDTCLLIDAEGKFVRPYATAGMQVRRLVFYDLAHRKKVAQQSFIDGWIPFDLEAAYVFNTTPENFDLKECVTLMPAQGRTAYSSITSFTGKDLINRYNQTLQGAGGNGREEVSSMIMSSFLESEDENSVSRIQQNLGDFIELGFDVNQSINYIDLIKDADGRAKYCLILFSGNYNFSRNYFEKVFRNKTRWPENIQYMAVSSRVFSISFPFVDMRMRMQRLFSMMQPPRNLHVEEHLINGKPHLLCAYVGKKLQGYVLCAAVSLEAIDGQLSGLKSRLILAACIVIAALIFVYVRLMRGVLRPARLVMGGVHAMEAHDHAHRIVIETSDEWQQLAGTFNNALEGMKELEVAHFVQTCILPGADICSGGARFAGRTVPA
ncbi:MAG: hypothetical protein CVV42_16385, partial [Candidatus Riflebacteria bacterium HGW-Riflebacteria-2]